MCREAPLNSVWEGSGKVNTLDVLRALTREPDALGAWLQEVGDAPAPRRARLLAVRPSRPHRPDGHLPPRSAARPVRGCRGLRHLLRLSPGTRSPRDLRDAHRPRTTPPSSNARCHDRSVPPRTHERPRPRRGEGARGGTRLTRGGTRLRRAQGPGRAGWRPAAQRSRPGRGRPRRPPAHRRPWTARRPWWCPAWCSTGRRR